MKKAALNCSPVYGGAVSAQSAMTEGARVRHILKRTFPLPLATLGTFPACGGGVTADV